MKKHPLPLLMLLTCIFAAFTLGFFWGRNHNHESVSVSAVSTVAKHDRTLVTDPTVSDQEKVSFPVNINTATLRELCALPGIGETLGQRILDYRALNGSFDRPEELMNVDGIGAGKLESILDFVTTGG